MDGEKCPGQALGVGVSKMVLCSVGVNEELLACHWGAKAESEGAPVSVLVRVQVI